MSRHDHPPRTRTAGPFWLLRFAAVLLVLCGMAWGVSEHDAVMSSAVGVAPPADDAPRDATWIDLHRSDDERDVAMQAPSVPLADPRAVVFVVVAPTTIDRCGTGCSGPPTLRGPPAT
jgi:hypothetical protein